MLVCTNDNVIRVEPAMRDSAAPRRVRAASNSSASAKPSSSTAMTPSSVSARARSLRGICWSTVSSSSARARLALPAAK